MSTTYTVQSGDTLSKIAARYGTTVSKIAQQNDIKNVNLIYVGQKLSIDSFDATPAKPATATNSAPSASSAASTSYTIQSGDTLSKIAARYGTTVSKIASDNGIKNPNLIYAGQKLTIRTSSGDSFVAPSNTAATTGVSAVANTPVSGIYPVTVDDLCAIMPYLSRSKATEYLPYLQQAMADAKINTKQRAACFIAQLAHESGQFRYMEEIHDGSNYEGRASLGNTQPGDGKRFKGRGPIQITGRWNYTKAAQDLGLDLVNHPELASDPAIGFRLSAWYWNYRNLNQYSDSGNFTGLTKAINGGTNGLSDRQAYYNKAMNVL